jgi:hypothetical protein
VSGDPSVLSPPRPPCNLALSSDFVPTLTTRDEDDGGESNEVGRFFSGSEPSSSSSPPLDLSPPAPPLDLRDAAGARVLTSFRVLFPPSSGELEGDGSGTVLYAFFCFSRIAIGFFDVATDYFFNVAMRFLGCCNKCFLQCCSTTV